MPPRKRVLDPYVAESSSVPVSSGPSSSKRVRFTKDDPAGDSDDEEDLEFPGSSKKGSKSSSLKRGNVKLEGYESDSSAGSDEEFGSRRSKDGVRVAAGEDDEDMFGSTAPLPGEEGDEAKRGTEEKFLKEDRPWDKGLEVKGSAKGKEFLDLNDIEGQEFGARDSEAVDDDVDIFGVGRKGKGKGKSKIELDQEEDDEEDEEDEEELAEEEENANADDAPRSRRSKKGMGFQLTGFNLKNELEEGRFSADGSFVANAPDPLAVHDTWLSGVDSKKAIKAARMAKEKADAREKEQIRKDREMNLPREDCMKAMLEEGLVRKGESVTESLKRLGNEKKELTERLGGGGTKAVKAKHQENGDMDIDTASSTTGKNPAPTNPELDAVTKKIDRLSSLASIMLSNYGEMEIYQETYRTLLGKLREEGVVRWTWDPQGGGEGEEEDGNAKGKSSLSGNRIKVTIARPSAPISSTAATETPSTIPAVPPETKFFYRWSPNLPPSAGVDPDQIHGPFSVWEMQGWVDRGFFGLDGVNVQVRKEGEGGRDWRSWKEIVSV